MTIVTDLPPQPPAHLSPSSRQWWETTVATYVLQENRDAKYYGAYSSDGIRWTSAKNVPILAIPRSDVSHFRWEQDTKKYIGYPKMWITVHVNENDCNEHNDWHCNRRSVGFLATKDFVTWPTSGGNTQATVILVPDYIDDIWTKPGQQHTDFYGLCGFAYESMYLGFLWIFQITDDVNDGPIFVELVTSHDGVNWRRQPRPRQPILPTGPRGAWDGGMVFTASHPLVEGKTIKLYYGGSDLTHDHENSSRAIGLATLRKDGFASLDAAGSPGSVLTRKCLGMRGPLRVNYKTNHGGTLRAEVLDADGKVVEGYGKDACHELKGDFVDAVVTWKGHTELPEAKGPLQIRFMLRNASLYSFAAGDSVEVLTFDSGVLYTFEAGDNERKTVRNRLSLVEADAPGEQDGRLLGKVEVKDDNGAYGKTSALNIKSGGTPEKPNAVEIPGTTNLGTTFTLSAMVKMTNTGLTRIFSSYSAVDSKAAAYEVLFDVDPSGGSGFILRAVINGTWVTWVPSGHVTMTDKYHHFAMTYDHGDVRLYFDGTRVRSGRVQGLGGPVFSFYELRVGHDWWPPATVSEQQLVGWVDDILVLPRALKDEKIKELCQEGAERYFKLTR